MANNNIEENLLKIDKSFNNYVIGKKNHIPKLINYFKEQLNNNSKGILLIVENRLSLIHNELKILFIELHKADLISNSNISEIDLSEYNFKSGYNIFLSDFNKALKDDSEAIIFDNLEKSSDEVMTILSTISPNQCINLNDQYAIKNSLLVDPTKSEKDIINNIVCNDKYFVFIYNNNNNDKEFFSENILPNKDCLIITDTLNNKEKKNIIKRKITEKIDSIKETYNVNVLLGFNTSNIQDDNFGICKYLLDDFKIGEGLDLEEYISYKIIKPITSIINSGLIDNSNKGLLYIEKNEPYIKFDKNIYKLSDYSVPTLDEIKYKFQSIIGMNELKEFLNTIENNYKVQKIRNVLGLKSPGISLNMIFAGNAGTGKTNAARLTYQYLNALDILKKPIFLEVSKVDFIGTDRLETIQKTNTIIESAIGGLLFIDEAYSLCKDKDDKIGKEIVDTLLKGIEDNRDNLVVILAGYEKDMEKFLSFNQGLKSRFSNVIHFNDYTPIEMYEIAVNIAKSKGYKIAENVKDELIELFSRNQLVGKNDLGNARFVRNVIENAIMDSANKYLSDHEREIDLLLKDNFNFKVTSTFDLEDKLKSIIGLNEVKDFLRNQYKLILAQEKRKSVGVTTKIEQNLNMVFIGNPGTGKTSIARLVADMLNSIGVLKVGQLIETDRSSFVSKIPGETPNKTEKKFKEAIGGILFIDEAYTLAKDSLGREAIDTLLKLIEDYSKEVIVILAGYEKEMEDFFDVNIGLKSRFPLWTKFEDYNANELFAMSLKLIESNGFKLSKNAHTSLRKSLVDIYENSDSSSGNGRMIRNYVEQLIRNQSIRIVENDISIYEMNLITTVDIDKMKEIKYLGEFDLEHKLESLVENDYIKEFLRNQYKVLKIQEKRKRMGFQSDINKYTNMIVTGECGTGKKTLLTILSEMYYVMGITKSKNFIEINSYELIEMFNQNFKIEDILNKYLDKVVYISRWDKVFKYNNYSEIVSQLIKFIDNNTNRSIIVLGGSKSKMKEIILTDEGLNYRFTLWVNFDSYNESELFNIALTSINKNGFIIKEDAIIELEKIIGEIQKVSNEVALKNGLMVKQYLDILIRIQSIRVFNEKCKDKEIYTINSTDIIKSKKEFLRKNMCTK
ncbi:AAA family ATPase [Clostridium botulinum]|nr:AAA family ATPase [Clostridium botulinum]